MTVLMQDVTKINSELLEKVIGNKTYREFIQYLLQNKKGENGLFVKHLREYLSKEAEELVLTEIERFNKKVEDRILWEKPAMELLASVDEELKKHNVYKPSHSACYLLLFTMNYVFFCYANRSFRKFLGVKKRSPFK